MAAAHAAPLVRHTGVAVEIDAAREDRIDWLRAASFVAMHLACVGVLWVGTSPIALSVAGRCMHCAGSR